MLIFINGERLDAEHIGSHDGVHRVRVPPGTPVDPYDPRLIHAMELDGKTILVELDQDSTPGPALWLTERTP